MKSLKLVAVLLLLGGISFGQASFYSGVAQTTTYINGTQASTPLPSAQILVCPFPGSCTSANKAVLYTDQTATVTASNPFFSDANGNFGFWGKSGNYQYVISSVFGTFGPYTLSIGGAGAAVITTNLAGLPADGAGTEGTLYNLTNGWQGLGIYKNGHARAQEPEINVQDFGARGDGGFYGGVGCASGSAVFTNVGVDAGRLPLVGDHFIAKSCGAAGANLECVLSSVSGVAFGTATCGGGITSGTTQASIGARWNGAAGVDDGPGMTAALSYCGSLGTKGCTINLPTGAFFWSTVTTPGTGFGRVTIRCAGSGKGGLGSTTIVGTGADQTDIIATPVGASANPITVENCGFFSWDWLHVSQIAVHLQGGVYHDIHDNSANSVYEFVRAEGVTEINIERNRIFPKVNGIHFGPTSFVTASNVSHNSIGSGFSGTAILIDNSSQQNHISDNTLQQDNPPFQSLINSVDSASVYMKGYEENSTPSITGGYVHNLSGQGNIVLLPYVGCEHISGQGTSVVMGLATSTCPAQTWSLDFSSQSVCFGCGEANIKGGITGGNYYGKFEMGIDGAIRVKAADINATKTATIEFINGIGATPQFLTGYAGLNSANPTTPNTPNGATFGSSGNITPFLWNYRANNAVSDPVFSPVIGWACVSGGTNCISNGTGYSSGTWGELGIVRLKRVREGTAAPSSNAWTVGDRVDNTAPTNTITAPCTSQFINVSAGSPGTFVNVPCGVNVMKTTVTLSPAIVAANTCAEQTFAIAGVLTTDLVTVNKPTAQAGLGVAGARASSAGNIGINFCNNTGAGITPTASEVYIVGITR